MTPNNVQISHRNPNTMSNRQNEKKKKIHTHSLVHQSSCRLLGGVKKMETRDIFSFLHHLSGRFLFHIYFCSICFIIMFSSSNLSTITLCFAINYSFVLFHNDFFVRLIVLFFLILSKCDVLSIKFDTSFSCN